MVQVSERPPPYSVESSSFPPPMRGDSGHRAWAFQRAFEEARELVRYSVLNTFKIWHAEWQYKGQKIPRENIQEAYLSAPEELKMAVEWQLRWDTAVWMTSDFGRRCHEHFRKEDDEGIEQEILSPDQFQKEFAAAVPATQQAVLLTIPTWMEENHGIWWPMPDCSNVKQAYEAATPDLKSAVSFILEVCWKIVPLSCPRHVRNVKEEYREMIMEHRLEAQQWDAKGEALGLW